MLAVFAASFALSFARSPSALLHPVLFAEDGTVWFQNAYDRGWSAALFQPHTGYLQTFPRVIADFGLLVPLGSVPFFFALVAIIVQVLPAVVFCSARFSALVPSLAMRAAFGALYLLVPNAIEVNVNLTNAQWHLGLLAFVVVIAQPSTAVLWAVFDVFVLVLSGLTGPFCLALAPIELFFSWRRRSRSSVLASVIVLGCAITQLVELSKASRGVLGPLGANIDRLIEILGGQVATTAVLGPRVLAHWQNGAYFLIWSVGALAVACVPVLAALVRAPAELKAINVFAGLVLGASLLTPVASETQQQWLVLAHDPGIRYWLFPVLVLLIDIAWCALVIRVRVLRVIAVALFTTTCVLALPSGFVIPAHARVDWGRQVAAFEALAPRHAYRFTIDPARWHMVLIKHR
jgi:hypothetical protein